MHDRAPRVLVLGALLGVSLSFGNSTRRGCERHKVLSESRILGGVINDRIT
jgi:hypothetical protein